MRTESDHKTNDSYTKGSGQENVNDVNEETVPDHSSDHVAGAS